MSADSRHQYFIVGEEWLSVLASIYPSVPKSAPVLLSSTFKTFNQNMLMEYLCQIVNKFA